MSEVKHTRGPWEIQTSCSFRRIGNSSGDGNVCYPTNQQSDGHPDLCFPNGGFNGPDARLIAAAPEMLAMLERIRDDQTWRTADNKLWPDLCAVIAKATGATQ
jgi:hypothetical protein